MIWMVYISNLTLMYFIQNFVLMVDGIFYLSDKVFNLFSWLSGTLRPFDHLTHNWGANILKYFTVSGETHFHLLLTSQIKIWYNYQYIISPVGRWMSNVCPCQFSGRYQLQQESYKGGGRTFWTTLVCMSFLHLLYTSIEIESELTNPLRVLMSFLVIIS